MELDINKVPASIGTQRRPIRAKPGSSLVKSGSIEPNAANNDCVNPESRIGNQLSQSQKKTKVPDRPNTQNDKKRKRNNVNVASDTGTKSNNWNSPMTMSPDLDLPTQIYKRFQHGTLNGTKMMKHCIEIICQETKLPKPVVGGGPLQIDLTQLDQNALQRIKTVLRLRRFYPNKTMSKVQAPVRTFPETTKLQTHSKPQAKKEVSKIESNNNIKSKKDQKVLAVQTTNTINKVDQKKVLRSPLLKKSPKLTNASQSKIRYCICQTPASEAMMIECSSTLKKPRCNGWVHLGCVGLDKFSEAELEKLTTFVCPLCKYEMEGKELDLLVPTTNEVKRICGLCHSSKSKASGMGPFIGPFLNRETNEGCWAHDFCAVGSSDAGLTEEGSWFNVAKTIHESASRKCLAKTCLQSKVEGASLRCTKPNCETIIHAACCRGIFNSLKRIPRIKSSNAVVQKAANEALAEKMEEIIVKIKQKWVCSGCKTKKSFREGKRKSTRLR